MAGFAPPPALVALGPATNSFVITPSGTALANLTRYIWVGSAGNLTLQLALDGATVTLSAIPAGTLLPVCAAYVTAFTGTAGTLIGFY